MSIKMEVLVYIVALVIFGIASFAAGFLKGGIKDAKIKLLCKRAANFFIYISVIMMVVISVGFSSRVTNLSRDINVLLGLGFGFVIFYVSTLAPKTDLFQKLYSLDFE